MHRVTFAQARPHVVAGIATVLILMAMLHVLLELPAPRERGATGSQIRLALLPRIHPAERQDAPRASQARASAVPAQARTQPRVSTSAAAPSQVPAAAAEPLVRRLYTADGRVRMEQDMEPAQPQRAGRAPGSVAAAGPEPAGRLMERANPIDYRPTRFDKDWASDGNLMQVADQALSRAMKKLKPGSGASPAEARPPPDVRFNPSLHERSADLGSEATGDAYKAAPIAFEKAPDLQGGASRRIRQSLGETESRYARCGGERIRALLAPALVHLQGLERVEHAMGNGADPIRAANLLPREADSAYDLARRAIWYAQSKLETCR